VAKKRSRNPALRAFGAWLEQKRGKASREQISIKLAALGVPLGGSTIAQYEKGTVWAPDPCVLWGLSRIYGHPVDQVIELLKTNRADPALDMFSNRPAAASSVQPDPVPEAAPPPNDENRPVSSDAATIRAATGELHATLREARELANQLRRATSAAILQKSRRQAPGPRVARTRKRSDSRKRSG